MSRLTRIEEPGLSGWIDEAAYKEALARDAERMNRFIAEHFRKNPSPLMAALRKSPAD